MNNYKHLDEFYKDLDEERFSDMEETLDDEDLELLTDSETKELHQQFFESRKLYLSERSK